MKFYDIEDTDDSTVTSTTDYSAYLDSLQAAVDTLTASLEALETKVNSNATSLSGGISDAETTAKTNLENAAAGLKGEIESFSSNFSKKVITAEADITDADIDSVKATKADIDSLAATNADIETADIGNAKATALEAVSTAVTGTLKAASAEIENLTASSFSFEEVDVAKAVIDKLTSTLAAIKTLETDKITVSDSGWRTPNTTPGNDELLKITVPAYNGTAVLVTRDNEFSVTIFNTAASSYVQNEALPIYRIENSSEGTNIYLANTGDTISYKLILVGDGTGVETTSEIVDRTQVENNTPGTVGFTSNEIIELKKGLEDETAARKEADRILQADIDGEEERAEQKEADLDAEIWKIIEGVFTIGVGKLTVGVEKDDIDFSSLLSDCSNPFEDTEDDIDFSSFNQGD